MQKIIDDIKNKNFQKIYLLFGEENYLKNKTFNSLKKALISETAKIMNLDIFNEKKPETKKISDACETLPFMNDLRVVIVKDSELFVQGNKDESEKMAEYIKNVPPTTVLIFVEEKVDKRGKLYKEVSKLGYCAEFKQLSEKELLNEVRKIAKAKRLVMKDSVILYFIRSIHNSMEAIISEIEKLSNYILEGEVSEKDIDDICTKSLEVKIFDMVDAIGNKKAKIALDIYNNMVLMKESPIMILAMISRQFRIIFQSKYLAEKGMYKSDIAKKINQREFVVSECLKQSKNFKKKTLLQALDDCLECDINIKTGKIQDKLGVEMIILKYSNLD